MTRQLSVLLLGDDRPGNANAILDHINSFSEYSRHQVRTLNPWGMRRSVALDLDEFDAVVIHYSLVMVSDLYVSEDFRKKLRRFRGLKVQFLQDDYRWVDRVTAALRDVGIDVLFTVAPEPGASQIYDSRLPGVRRVQTLTGYVPENLQMLRGRPLAERSIDIGYRGRQLPFWVGKLSQEKVWIAQEFLARGRAYALRMDIGWREEERIYGDRWIDLIGSSRAMLGTESGASITDFDGTVERAVRGYLRAHPGASFAEVEEGVLKPYEGNVMMNVISPRVFEAAALGTALVMFPGYYSGVVQPHEHYILLEKDFSNLDEVVAQLKDDDCVRSVTERAHKHVIESGLWSYATFVRQFDDVIEEEARITRGRSSTPRFYVARIERTLRVPPLRVRLARGVLSAASRLRGRRFARQSELESGAWLAKGTMALRAALRDPDLRPLFLEGRRSHVAMDRLLEEILELSILRQAARGALPRSEAFTLASQFDAASGTVRFTSGFSESGWQQPARLSGMGLDALRAGAVNSIEWDHRAIGPTVRFGRKPVEVGIGLNGLTQYGLLTQIGRRNPGVAERALSPLIDSAGSPERPKVGVG
jgi:hypothetical protein